jgi:hypothetical protein
MMYLIHCKNFCKHHNVPPPSKTIKMSKNLKTFKRILCFHENISIAQVFLNFDGEFSKVHGIFFYLLKFDNVGLLLHRWLCPEMYCHDFSDSI